MVNFQLNLNLDSIASGEGLSETVFELITWIDARDRIEDLVQGARKDNPGNELLRVFEMGQGMMANLDKLMNETQTRIEQLVQKKYGARARVGLGTALGEVDHRVEPFILAGLWHWINLRNQIVREGKTDLFTPQVQDLGRMLLGALEATPACYGRYTIIENKWSHRVLDEDGAGQDNGVGVFQYTRHGSDNQRWRLDLQGDGSYALCAEHSGRCLSVGDSSRENSAGMVQWDWGNGLNQRWWLTPLDDGSYRLLNVNSGKALDATWTEGAWARLVQFDWHGQDNQRWLIHVVP
jgi:hypothetical protein